jgi:hypothetical protein
MGATTQAPFPDHHVRVTRSADGTRATPNPYGSSATVRNKNTTYLAVVSAGAKDLAGNSLDQYSRITGNQPLKWSFKTGNKLVRRSVLQEEEG